MKAKKYRIVTDDYAGYEVQVWNWYWPFWVQMDHINTFPSVRMAEEYIEKRSKKVKFKSQIIKTL